MHTRRKGHEVIHGCADCCNAAGRWIGPAPTRWQQRLHRVRVWLHAPEFVAQRWVGALVLVWMAVLALVVGGVL